MPTMPPLDPREVLGLSPEALPRHVAIIMDGNGRWARQRGLPRIEGHRQGAQAVRAIVESCARLGVQVLTLYSFSLENWKRPQDEVTALMALYAEYLAAKRPELMDNDIRLLQVGRRSGLPSAVLSELERTMELTRGNQRMTLCLALNYGSRAEIIDCVRSIAGRVQRGELKPEDITEQTISDGLYTRRVARSGPADSTAAKCGSATSCSGRSATPSFMLRRCCGQIFGRRTCTKRCVRTGSVSGALGRCWMRRRLARRIAAGKRDNAGWSRKGPGARGRAQAEITFGVLMAAAFVGLLLVDGWLAARTPESTLGRWAGTGDLDGSGGRC